MARAASTAPKSTGATVTVACKLPAGQHLEIQTGKGDQLQFTRFATLRGSNHESAVGGYGLTHGVDADLFDQWRAQHKFLPAVKNNLIFAHARPTVARDQAREYQEVRSGMERLDPDKPMPGIEPTDDQRTRTAKILAGEDEDAVYREDYERGGLGGGGEDEGE